MVQPKKKSPKAKTKKTIEVVGVTEKEVTILQCPRCRHTYDWDREEQLGGPGKCLCGAYAPWIVLKEHPDPGFVHVLSEEGWQQLHGPHWRPKRPGEYLPNIVHGKYRYK